MKGTLGCRDSEREDASQTSCGTNQVSKEANKKYGCKTARKMGNTNENC